VAVRFSPLGRIFILKEMDLKSSVFSIFLTVTPMLILMAQENTGSVQGTVVDENGRTCGFMTMPISVPG
jgi:hypothetical protein